MERRCFPVVMCVCLLLGAIQAVAQESFRPTFAVRWVEVVPKTRLHADRPPDMELEGIGAILEDADFIRRLSGLNPHLSLRLLASAKLRPIPGGKLTSMVGNPALEGMPEPGTEAAIEFASRPEILAQGRFAMKATVEWIGTSVKGIELKGEVLTWWVDEEGKPDKGSFKWDRIVIKPGETRVLWSKPIRSSGKPIDRWHIGLLSCGVASPQFELICRHIAVKPVGANVRIPQLDPEAAGSDEAFLNALFKANRGCSFELLCVVRVGTSMGEKAAEISGPRIIREIASLPPSRRNEFLKNEAVREEIERSKGATMEVRVFPKGVKGEGLISLEIEILTWWLSPRPDGTWGLQQGRSWKLISMKPGETFISSASRDLKRGIQWIVVLTFLKAKGVGP